MQEQNAPIHYIYVLKDPRDGRVRYVGKTKRLRGRLREHINQPRSEGLRRWISELSASELKPAIEVIEECFGDLWVESEKFWVSEYRAKYPDLLNVLRGGGGPLEKDYTADVREVMSLRSRASHRKPEFRAASSAWMKAYYSQPEVRASVSAKMKAYWASPEARAKKAAQMKKLKNTPEARAAQSALMSTPEARAAVSLRSAARWAKQGEREAQSAKMKARWSSPEARAAQAEKTKAQWAKVSKEELSAKRKAVWARVKAEKRSKG